MYPEDNPIFSAGSFTVHKGKLSSRDARGYWIEGPTLTGRLAPIASCWNEGTAVRLAQEMAAKAKVGGDVAGDAEMAARVRASEAYHDHPSNPSSCSVFEEHNRGRRCPCENEWMDHLSDPAEFQDPRSV